VSGGRSGKTHCGQWTGRIPPDVSSTRLVCNEPFGHTTLHYSSWSGYEWDSTDMPRKRKRKLVAR
jgi:hypothetical protein